MKIFVNENDEFTVKLFITEDEKGKMVATCNQEEFDKYNDKMKEVTNDYVLTLRYPSYKDNVNISKKAISFDGENIHIDSVTLRFERFLSLLKGWTLTDDSGNKVPITRDTVGSLDPIIAGVILDKVDETLV